MFYRSDPWLHVIVGCMSSGKTDELLRLLRRAEIARRRVLLVRPDVDENRVTALQHPRRGIDRDACRTVFTDGMCSANHLCIWSRNL